MEAFFLPTLLAGLGLFDPILEIFKTSKQGTVVIANALIGKDTFCHVSHLDALNEARQMHRKVQENLHQSSLESILAKFTHERQRSIQRVITSAWLNVIPLESCHFDLAPSQFRDDNSISTATFLYTYQV